MKLKLFYLTWKEITRSSAFGKSVATNIMLGFLALYFGLIFLALGLSLPQILKEKYPDSDPVSVFNSLLLIYFAFDLLIRQLLQSLPTISFKPLIVLNIRRREISRYLLFRSVFHFFNFLPLFLLVPVCFTLVAPGQRTGLAYRTGSDDIHQSFSFAVPEMVDQREQLRNLYVHGGLCVPLWIEPFRRG